MIEKRYFTIETAMADVAIRNLWPHFAHVAFLAKGEGGREFLMQCDKERETMYEGNASWQKDHLSKHDERVGRARDEAILAKVIDSLQYVHPYAGGVVIAYNEEAEL